MNDCCATHELPRLTAPCPGCGAHGRAVGDETISALLKPEHAEKLLRGPRKFCRTPSCPVVYYGEHHVVEKADVPVRVGVKEHGDPVPLCYCFGFTLADVRREIAETGGTAIPARIAAAVRAGQCACATRNPSGACCLGDVNRATAREEASGRLPTAALK